MFIVNSTRFLILPSSSYMHFDIWKILVNLSNPVHKVNSTITWFSYRKIKIYKHGVKNTITARIFSNFRYSNQISRIVLEAEQLVIEEFLHCSLYFRTFAALTQFYLILIKCYGCSCFIFGKQNSKNQPSLAYLIQRINWVWWDWVENMRQKFMFIIGKISKFIKWH